MGRSIEEFDIIGTENRPSVGEASPARPTDPESAFFTARLRPAAAAITTLPSLAALLVIFTLLAMGPLQGLDQALNKPWSDWILPQGRSFVDDVLDPIASQAVALPLLAVTATVLAWRRRAWRPLLVAAAAELGVVGLVGTMKVFFARTSPVLEDPSFFAGGLFSHGGYGIIFPSGHAAQAVVLYGVLVYLLGRYGSAPRRTLTLLSWMVAAITAMTMLTSIYLGWHWTTDLIAGVLAGGLVLRTTVLVDRALPEALPRQTVPAQHAAHRPGYQPVGYQPAYRSEADVEEPAEHARFVSQHR